MPEADVEGAGSPMRGPRIRGPAGNSFALCRVSAGIIAPPASDQSSIVAAGYPLLASQPLNPAPPQTVHLAFMSPRPLFFMRGSMEVESHGEEKEEELEIEDLKRASL